MRFISHRRPGVQLALLAGIVALAGGLAGCGGSSNALGPISGLGPAGNNAQVRFVNGSPDAGPIQVFIDNQQQFCGNGNTGTACSLSYGQITTYAVNLGAGQHAIVLKDQNGATISIPSGTLSVNAGTRYSLVLTGELHPSYNGGTPNLSVTVFHDQPFNTPSGGAAVNAHYASPYLASTNPSPLQFGYFVNSNTTATTPIGQTVSFGGETLPTGIQASGLNAPITFFAGTPTGTTVTPSQINSTNCASNALPCSTGNLDLYLIDGPAASTSPTTQLPANISASAKSVFVGTFD